MFIGTLVLLKFTCRFKARHCSLNVSSTRARSLLPDRPSLLERGADATRECALVRSFEQVNTHHVDSTAKRLSRSGMDQPSSASCLTISQRALKHCHASSNAACTLAIL